MLKITNEINLNDFKSYGGAIDMVEFNHKIDNIYYCNNNVIIDNGVVVVEIGGGRLLIPTKH